MAPPTVPLTWRNVSAPDGSGALNAFNRAGENLGNAFEGLGGHIKQGASDYADRETQDFIADLNAAPDDATRKQMVVDASQAFLKMDQVNAAVTDAEGLDIRRAGEERAVTSAAEDTAAHKSDLETAISQRATAESQRKIAEAREAEDLANEDLVRNQLIAQTNASKATTGAKSLETKLTQAKLTEFNRVNGNKAKVTEQMTTVNALPEAERLAEADRIMSENKINRVDNTKWKEWYDNQMDSATFNVSDTSLALLNTTKPDGAGGFIQDNSPAKQAQVRKAIEQNIKTRFKHSTPAQRQDLADKAILKAGLTQQFAHGTERANRSIAEVKVQQDRDAITRFSVDIDKEQDPAARAKLLADAKQYAEVNDIAEDQAKRLGKYELRALTTEFFNIEESLRMMLGRVAPSATAANPNPVDPPLSIEDFAPGNRQKLVNALVSELEGSYKYVPKTALITRVTQAITESGLDASFTKGAQPVALGAALDKGTFEQQVALQKERSNKLVAMGSNAEGNLVDAFMTKVKGTDDAKDVDKVKLQGVVHDSLEQIKGIFSAVNLSKQAENALKIASHDMLSNINVDYDFPSKNNYVHSVNPSKDASVLTNREYLQALMSHLPRDQNGIVVDTAKVKGTELENAIKRMQLANPASVPSHSGFDPNQP